MLIDQVQALVSEAVTLLLPRLPKGHAALSERALASLVPYVTKALEEAGHAATVTAEPRDKRSKPWLVTVRFWLHTPIGEELVALDDPTVIYSTGGIPPYVTGLSQEMHGEIPPELSAASLEERLPQLRNNLGRYGSAVLRVEYAAGGELFKCQIDVVRVEED